MYEHVTGILITHMLQLEIMSHATRYQSDFLEYVKWCHYFKDILEQAEQCVMRDTFKKYPINIQSKFS